VRLPAVAPSEPETLSPPPSTPQHALASGLRVLLADDNVDFAVSLQATLETVGMAVDTVADGRAALAAARERHPDVAILDIGMPGLNGYDLARALRGDPDTADIVLFAVSGWGQASDKALATQAGFDRHFVKPVAVETLIDAMAEAMASDPGRESGSRRED